MPRRDVAGASCPSHCRDLQMIHSDTSSARGGSVLPRIARTRETRRRRVLPIVMATALGTLLLFGCSRESPDAMVESAKGYIAQQKFQSAIIQLKNALQQDPKRADVRYLLGMVLVDSGDSAGAEIELSKARDLGHPMADLNPLFA